jgi:hypothetical protein
MLKILDKLDEQVKCEIHATIESVVAKQTERWENVVNNSNDYMACLGIQTDSEMDLIFSYLQPLPRIGRSGLQENMHGAFLKIEVADRLFSFFVNSTYPPFWGGRPKWLIQVGSEELSLNRTFGEGTGLTNTIPYEYHRAVLEKLSEYKSSVLQKIALTASRNQEILTQTLSHSRDYMEKLGLTMSDVSIIKYNAEIQPSTYGRVTLEDHMKDNFLELEVDGKQFGLYAHSTFDNGWKETIKAVCINDPSLNATTGDGTTQINAIPEIWHKKLLEKLEGDKSIQDNLREKIRKAS